MRFSLFDGAKELLLPLLVLAVAVTVQTGAFVVRAANPFCPDTQMNVLHSPAPGALACIRGVPGFLRVTFEEHEFRQAMRESRDAQREAARAAREAHAEARKAMREAEREVKRAVRDTHRREIRQNANQTRDEIRRAMEDARREVENARRELRQLRVI